MRDELIVMCSGAFITVLNDVAPGLEEELGIIVKAVQGPSIGDAPRAIPVRLRRGEPADLVILFDDAIQDLIADGTLLGDTKVRLGASNIGVAVRQGASEPDIGTEAALRRALIASSSFACSASASGRYVSTTLLARLDLGPEVAAKGFVVTGEPVGAVVARGGAELGFQQISELLPVEGVRVLGPLPPGLQCTTVISAALPRAARKLQPARALLARLSSRAAQEVVVRHGLSPVSGGER